MGGLKQIEHNPKEAGVKHDFSPRNVVVSGFRVSAAAFAVGMVGLLYAILTASEWALFWWAFLAVSIPLCAYFFYHETRLFYAINRDGNDWSAPEPRHRMLIAVVALVAACAAAIYLYPY